MLDFFVSCRTMVLDMYNATLVSGRNQNVSVQTGTERIWKMRERIRDRVLRCDAERAVIMTEASKKYENIVPIIRRPLMFQEVAKRITTLVDDDDLLWAARGRISSPAPPIPSGAG